jgi:hypothetical protein
MIALFLEGQSVWSLAFSLIGATVALTSAVAGMVYARRLSLTSKASPLAGVFRWLVVYAVLYFALAVFSGALSLEAAQRADLLRNGKAIPGTPDSMFCQGFFRWEGRPPPKPIRLIWPFETILGSFTVFANIPAVPGCIDITKLRYPHKRLYHMYDFIDSQFDAIMPMVLEEMSVIYRPMYAAELRRGIRRIGVPKYRFGPDRTMTEGAVQLHLCRPGLYAFQDGWLRLGQEGHPAGCMDTRATKFLPWCSWILSLIVMGFAFRFLGHVHSMVGKVEAVATVLAERKSGETPTSEADAAPTSRDSDAEQTSLLAIILGKGVGRRNRARDLKKPV